MARELAPAGLRSGPKKPAPASLSNGSKLPRHKSRSSLLAIQLLFVRSHLLAQLASSRVSSGSERWVPGTPATLLKNAKIWTGARNGTEIVYGDVLLDKGLVVAVGYIPPSVLSAASEGTGGFRIQDVAGKWVTPGLVDLHSHLGVSSAPGLSGTFSRLTDDTVFTSL